MTPPPAPPTPLAPPDGRVVRLLRELSVHDWVVLGYLGVVVVVASLTPSSPNQLKALRHFAILFAVVATVVVLVRSKLLRHGLVAPLAYRLAIYAGVQLSYFLLGDLLPALDPVTLDHALWRLDLDWFGVEPALWLDRTVSPLTTEWFAFFYFCYFFLLGLYVLPLLLLSRSSRLLGEFSLGLILVFCIGHTLYMLVPGFGPYHALAGEFTHTLPNGVWHDVVMQAVTSGGSMLDIFPSLHTAGPSFLTLFSLRHRDVAPYRQAWPITAFCTVNIIVATMFLRWHYVIDVIAGLALATAALAASTRLTRVELLRRARLGLGPTWPDYQGRPRAVPAQGRA